MRLGLLAIAAAGLLVGSTFQADAASLLQCGDGPLDLHNCPLGPTGPQGPAGADGKDGINGTNGIDGKDGVQGPAGPQGVAGKDGQNGTDGTDGKNGKDGRDGRDFDMDKALALSSAMSMPVWLGDNESFRVSGGVGFSDGESALGATAVFRLDPVDKNLAGFVGGAVSSDGNGWGGRAGLSYGF